MVSRARELFASLRGYPGNQVGGACLQCLACLDFWVCRLMLSPLRHSLTHPITKCTPVQRQGDAGSARHLLENFLSRIHDASYQVLMRIVKLKVGTLKSRLGWLPAQVFLLTPSSCSNMHATNSQHPNIPNALQPSQTHFHPQGPRRPAPGRPRGRHVVAGGAGGRKRGAADGRRDGGAAVGGAG